MPDFPCNTTWGTCPFWTQLAGKPQPHHCGEWYLKGIKHVHICDGCQQVK